MCDDSLCSPIVLAWARCSSKVVVIVVCFDCLGVVVAALVEPVVVVEVSWVVVLHCGRRQGGVQFVHTSGR